MAKVIKCGTCGSTDVEFKADVQWDETEQRWTVPYVYDDDGVNCFANDGCGSYQPFTVEIDGVPVENPSEHI